MREICKIRKHGKYEHHEYTHSLQIATELLYVPKDFKITRRDLRLWGNLFYCLRTRTVTFEFTPFDTIKIEDIGNFNRIEF